MPNPASDRARSGADVTTAVASRALLELPLRRDTIEVAPDSLVIWRLRWGIRLRHVIAAADVLSLGYRRSRFRLRSALQVGRPAANPFRFSFGIRPYEAELALGELRRSGLWIANRLESPTHGVFVTSPSAP